MVGPSVPSSLSSRRVDRGLLKRHGKGESRSRRKTKGKTKRAREWIESELKKKGHSGDKTAMMQRVQRRACKSEGGDTSKGKT